MDPFPTGSSVANWQLTIISDRLEERNEKLKVLLRDPVNAILGLQDKTVIQLVNLENGTYQLPKKAGMLLITLGNCSHAETFCGEHLVLL